jgi:amino acid transporter
MAESTPTNISPRLGLWDTVSIIVGIVVGTAIFRSPPAVFANVGGPWLALGLWLAGGMLAWCGAVCYAELAASFPRDGGDYEYLNRAFGNWSGFLFAWAQLTTVVSGNIAIMAYAFADYGVRLWPAWKEQAIWLVLSPVLVLSIINVLGVVAGKLVQNLLTATKVAGLGGLVLAGLLFGGGEPDAPAPIEAASSPQIGLALVFVLYAYGGWSHAAFVAAEVRDQRRNLPRALLFGIVGITIVYLSVNATYLHVLGFVRASQSPTPATDVLELTVGTWGARAISVLVMVSALGAINGMILTGTRVYATWGADYPALAWLGGWNRRAAPVASIGLQAAIALLLIALVGTGAGRNLCDGLMQSIGLNGLPWDEYSGGFETLVAGSTPVYWTLSLLTGFALFVLRAKQPSLDRPYSMPLFPLPALAYCATCAYMLWASIAYARWLLLLGFVPLAVGAVIGFTLQPKNAAR